MRGQRWLWLGVAFAGALVLPLCWALLASLTPEERLFTNTSFAPGSLTFDHYRALFAGRDFWTPIRNSLIVAGATTIVSVALGAISAYAGYQNARNKGDLERAKQQKTYWKDHLE